MEAMSYENIDPFTSSKIDYWGKALLLHIYDMNRTHKSKRLKMQDFAPPWEKSGASENQDLNDQIKEAFGIPR